MMMRGRGIVESMQSAVGKIAPLARERIQILNPRKKGPRGDLAVPAGFAGGLSGKEAEDKAGCVGSELEKEEWVAFADVSSGYVNVGVEDGAVVAALRRVVEGGGGDVLGDWAQDGGREEVGRVLIDFGSPNLGKRLHVGHMRSYVLGNALAALHDTMGAQCVTRVSHEGDFGTPMGLIMAAMVDASRSGSPPPPPDVAYVQAKARVDAEGPDSPFASLVQHCTLNLQREKTGEEETKGGEEDWSAMHAEIVAQSRAFIDPLVASLGVQVEPRPESTYAPLLPGVVSDLKSQSPGEEGDAVVQPFEGGAWGVMTEEYASPLLFQKANGGYLYAAVDLAAVRARASASPRYEKVIYVTDASQEQHFDQVFAAAPLVVPPGSGWSIPSLHHVGFGLVRSPKTKAKISSRDQSTGRDLELATLLENAREATGGNADLAVAALKFYDLLRPKGYVLDVDAMLEPSGKTAVYVNYALARVEGLERKAQLGDLDGVELDPASWSPKARNLALQVCMLPSVIRKATQSCAPVRVASATHSLAHAFHSWYGSEPILSGENPSSDAARLLIARSVKAALEFGLQSVGVPRVTTL